MFIATVREEKIAWSYGSMVYVHLYSWGAALWDHGFVGKES